MEYFYDLIYISCVCIYKMSTLNSFAAPPRIVVRLVSTTVVGFRTSSLRITTSNLHEHQNSGWHFCTSEELILPVRTKC